MTRVKTVALLALTLLAASACTRRVQVESEPNQPSNNLQTSEAQPAEVDMVGVYDYRVEAGGDVITGPMTVTRAADGAYGVAIAMDDGNTVPTRNVRRSGNNLSMDVSTPGGEGSVTLRWTSANDVEGDVFLGDIIPITATRRQ